MNILHSFNVLSRVYSGKLFAVYVKKKFFPYCWFKQFKVTKVLVETVICFWGFWPKIDKI